MKNPLRFLLAAFALLSFTVLRAEDKPAAPVAATAKVDVTGTWNMELETAQGKGTPSFTLKQEGEKLTGRYKGRFGEADVTGTLKGADISFTFKISGPNGELAMTYTGTVDGDTMKGNVKFGGQAGAAFTGKKAPAAK